MQLYKKFLNYSNITYLIIKVKKLRFKKLNFIIYFTTFILKILKITIFINNIITTNKIKIYF